MTDKNLVFFRHCAGQIHGREQHEDVRLQQRNEDVQAKKNYWNADRNQRKENQRHKIAREHVRVKTNGERHHARDVADDFDWHHQWREQRHWSGKVFGVLERALFLYALPVIVDPCDDREPERNSRCGCRRLKSGNKSYQIADQDEQSQSHQKGRESLAVVADDFLALLIDELFREFKDVLHCAWLIDGNARACPEEQHQQNQDDQNLHGEEVRDRSGRIVGEQILALLARSNGMSAESRQNARGGSAEVLVQKVGKEQFFLHALGNETSGRISSHGATIRTARIRLRS